MSAIQALRFPADRWARQDALVWATRHGLTPIKVTYERGVWSLRVRDPVLYDRFVTKKVLSARKPIHLVIGFKAPRYPEGF